MLLNNATFTSVWKSAVEMAEKRKVAMLCGGQSAEHEVSISSARTCAGNLSLEKYALKPVCILRDGRWMLPAHYTGDAEEIKRFFSTFESVRHDLRSVRHDLRSVRHDLRSASQGREREILLPINRDQNDNAGLSVLPVLDALRQIQREQPDVVFILLHGPYGEDGTLQGLLDFLGLCYTCSGVLASSLAMDKIRCQQFLSYHGVPTPRFVPLRYPTRPDCIGVAANALHEVVANVEKRFGFPCVVKPSRQGSSVGMGIAKSAEDLPRLLSAASEYDDEMLIEEYIRGTEVTCGVLDLPDREGPPVRAGTTKSVALPPTEIVPKERPFFDYYSKYTPGKSDEITPARLPAPVLESIQSISLKVYDLIGCRGMGRVDMIVRGETPYVLEINTIPGMTPTSLLPQGARAYGIDFPHLLDIILESALRQAKHSA